MAILQTSGAFSGTSSVITILNAAMRLTQLIGDEETATGAQLQNGLKAMSAMVRGWQASGIHVWCEEECILFLEPGQTTYKIGAGSPDHVTLFEDADSTTMAVTALAGATSVIVSSVAEISDGMFVCVQLDAGTNFWTVAVGPPSGSTVTIANALPSQASAGALVFAYATPLYRPLRVMGGRRYNYRSRINVPMQMWARLDYHNQPNDFTTGTPTAFFYDPQTGQGSYQLPVGLWNSWPTPQDYNNAAQFTAQRPIQDLGTLANTPDFPDEWEAALKWNLALELGPEHGTPTEQMTIIGAGAKKWWDMASGWDRESESIVFGVAMTPGQRRG